MIDYCEDPETDIAEFVVDGAVSWPISTMLPPGLRS